MDQLNMEDLALFNGDLLSMGLSSAPLYATADQLLSPDSSPISSGPQDELSWLDLRLDDSNKNHSLESTVEVTDLPSCPGSPALEDILSSAWMDARIDLSSIEQPSVPPQPELPVDDAVLALEVPAASLPSEPLVTISESDISSLFENFGQPLSLPSGVESPEAAFVVEGTTPSSPAAQSDQPLDMFDILSQMTPGILDNSAEHPADVALSCDLILSPMSPEEVESLLSSEPSSPQSTPLDDSGSMDQDSSLSSEVSSADTLSELARELQKAAPAPRRKGSRSTRAAPYSKPATSREAKVVERKERKKQQNKDAALRYRQKKKAENCSALSECEQLEIRNKELHEKVDSMTREISYLKSLMAEVYKAKGLLKTK